MSAPQQEWSEQHRRMLRQAMIVAENSDDPHKQVGAVLGRQTRRDEIAPRMSAANSTAYSGYGLHYGPDGHIVRPAKYDWIQHAEDRLISLCASQGVKTAGAYLYCTLEPCLRCANQIVTADISAVFIPRGAYAGPAHRASCIWARRLLRTKGVAYHEIGGF